MVMIRIKGTVQLYVKVLDERYKVIINKQPNLQVNQINKPNPLLNKQIQPKLMPQPLGSFTQSPHKNSKQPSTPEQHISLLTTQLTQLQQQHHKLSSKYERSLKQLALIVKANETLKQDYDALQAQVNRLVEQRSQQHQARLKEYFQKQLDELNARIHQLSQDKDRLEVENSSLRLKVSQYSLQKTTLSRQLQQVNRKYQNICSKQQALDPQQHDQSMKDTFLEQLKHKARLVDQLQEALHLMEQQKNTIQQSYEKRLQEILTLWDQLHIQGKRKGRLSEAKLYESSYVTEEAMGRFANRHAKRRSENVEVQEKTYDAENRQQAIYEKGLRLIKGGNDMLLANSSDREQPTNLKQQQQQHELSFYRQRINDLQQQNHHLSQVIEHLSNSNTPTHQLETAYRKLQQQHQLLQQKYASLRISNLLPSQPAIDPTIKQQQDLITILKQLHQQLSPLRQQLITLKRQHAQHKEKRAEEKATYEIKVIRLEKEGELMREQNQMLKRRLGEVTSEKQTAKQLSDRIKLLEEEKARLQAKLILYEAVSVTDRTRVSSQTYSVLKQFQRKMQLITSTQPNQFIHHTQHNPSSHLHQLLTMKAYILQLDQKTKQLQLQNQKLHKKYLLIKQKLAQSNTLLQQSTSRQGTRLQLYRQRIQAYDKLVGKLTLQLQRHVGKMQFIQGRNSSILNSKNTTLGNNHKPSTQITLILNSYEQKMTNMAQQIMRLKKDNRQYEHQLTVIRQQLKSKTQQLELKIRELNDKERQIVMLKTEAITLNNSMALLKRIIEEKEMGSGVNGDTKVARNSVNGGGDSTGRDSAAMEEKVNTVRQVYEKQLHYKLSQLQQQKQLMIATMKQQHNQQLSQLGTQHEQQLQSKQNQLQQLNQLLISKQQQISQLLTSTQHLQSQLSQLHSHKTLLQSRLRQSQLLIQTKDQQVCRLNDLLHKSNSQLEQQQKNTYEHKKSTYYNNIQAVNKNIGLPSSQQQLLEQNKQLHSRLYEGNVKMTSLQARIFNLNLQLQRIKSHNGILQDRIQELQAQIKQKNSAIFKLEDQCRSIANLRQAEQMARESAVRLYQNQVKNLKYTLMQLRMSQKEGGIRRLQQQNSLRPQSNTRPDTNTQVPSPSTNLQSQLKQTILQLQQKHLLVQQLTIKIKQLESRLQQQQSQQQSSSMMEVSQQQYQKLRSQVQKLKAQEFVFRREKMGLQGEIQVKEGEISRLKQELWAIKLQSKRLQRYEREAEGNSNNDNRPGGWQENRNNGSDNLIPSPNQLSNHSHYQQQYQQLQQHDQQLPQQQPHPSLQHIPTNSPIKLSIPPNQTSALTITQQPSFNYSTNSNQQQTISSLQQRISQYQLFITQLQSQLTELKFTNQELVFHEQQNQEAIRMLNEEVFRLIDQVRYFEQVIGGQGNVIRDSEQLQHELEKRGNQGGNRIEDSSQGNQHQLQQLNNYSINQTDSNDNDNSHNNPKLHPSSIHQATNNIQCTNPNLPHNPNPIAPTQAILQKIHRGQPMTSTQRQQLLTQDVYNMSLLIQHMNQDHSLKTQHFTTKLKQLQHQLMSKDLKISQLNRLLLQARIASNNSSNINISSVSQTGQQPLPSQFEYFITEIQRLTQLLKQRQRQLQDAKVMLDKYRSEKARYQENLGVMVVMMVEVEAVRLQLSEALEKVKEKETKEVQGNRVRGNVKTINNSSIDQQFIKVLEGSHRHLVDYGEILRRNIPNSGYNPRQPINNDRTSNTSSIPNIRQSLFSLSRPSQPQLYSNNSIQSALTHNQVKLPPPTPTPHTPTPTLPQPHPIDQIRHQQIQSYPSYPSQSGVSLNNISSTYSIHNPLKAYYRNAQSTYNPLSFSPPNNPTNITTQHKRTSSIQQHKEVKQSSNRTIMNDSNSINYPKPAQQIRYYSNDLSQPLGSYYKISQSKNVESSYGEGLDSGNQGEYYGYMLKNVNMVNSVGRDHKDIQSPYLYAKGQESPGYGSNMGPRHKQSLINSLAEERLGENSSMRYQKVIQESGKYNSTNQESSNCSTKTAYNHSNNQATRNSSTRIPSTSTITVHPSPYQPINLASHPATYTPLSFTSSSKLSSINSHSNTHLPTSSSHLPSYPNNPLSSATLAQYYNSPLYQTTYNSTLDNSSSTYQQYLSKIG